MKNNKKMILSSALILALSISIIKPSYAEDMGQNNEAVVTENEEVMLDENGDSLKDLNNPPKSNDPEVNVEDEDSTKVSNDSNQNMESTPKVKEIVREGRCYLDIEVSDRKAADWYKPGSTLIIDGKSYNLGQFSPYINKQFILPLDETFSVEIKDASGKTYATGSFSTPSEFGGYGEENRIKVYMNLSENANQKKFNLRLMTRSKSGRLDNYYYPGEVYLYADGILIGKTNSHDHKYLSGFVGEVGKTYKIEARDGNDYENSKLLATGIISVPKEGELTDTRYLDLILTPVGEESKPDKDNDNVKPDDDKDDSKDPDKNESGKKDQDNSDNKDSNKDNINENDNKNPDKEESDDDKDIPGLDSKAYDTQKEAEDAAREALKHIKTKDSFTISKGDEDGKYYYHLWNTEDEKTSSESNKKTESDNKSKITSTKPAVRKIDSTSTSKKKSTNVKTGVTGLSGLFAVLGAATAGLFISKKNK